MADAAMYFIWHDEAQLHSTRGALGQIGLKSPRHYLSCLLRREVSKNDETLRAPNLMHFKR